MRLGSHPTSGSSEGRISRPGSGSSAGPPRPAPLLLTCLVMEYCSGGTLGQAIQRSVFYRGTGQSAADLNEVGPGAGGCLVGGTHQRELLV